MPVILGFGCRTFKFQLESTWNKLFALVIFSPFVYHSIFLNPVTMPYRIIWAMLMSTDLIIGITTTGFSVRNERIQTLKFGSVFVSRIQCSTQHCVCNMQHSMQLPTLHLPGKIAAWNSGGMQCICVVLHTRFQWDMDGVLDISCIQCNKILLLARRLHEWKFSHDPWE